MDHSAVSGYVKRPTRRTLLINGIANLFGASLGAAFEDVANIANAGNQTLQEWL